MALGGAPVTAMAAVSPGMTGEIAAFEALPEETAAQGVEIEAALSLPYSAKIQSSNSFPYGSSFNYVYNGTCWDLMHWIKFGPSDGRRVYTFEHGTTGQGFFNGSLLTFASSGTFVIGIVTEETDIYAQTPKVFFTIHILKGRILAPTVDAVNATTGSSNGKLTGLIANKACEYKSIGASSYTSANTNENGQITGLPAGTYVVRYPDNDLHAASSDSNLVIIGEDAPLIVNPPSSCLKAAAYGYGP
jgi:hypothetical protein